MPEFDYEEMKKEAEQYIKFEKDKANRIAYITFDRPDAQNATSLGMRQLYADLIHKCNVDDDVKVVVIRGEGQDFGSGGDLPEQRGMIENPGMPLLHELAINDDDVKYPPGGSYRYLSTVTDFYAKARAGNRPLQELRKVSIIEAKGYCYGWHFYQAGDADLVISSDDALFGHPAFRYVGWGPRLWWWAETMGLRKFSEMLFTGRRLDHPESLAHQRADPGQRPALVLAAPGGGPVLRRSVRRHRGTSWFRHSALRRPSPELVPPAEDSFRR